ncbi:MAG TPA: tetratricopeptide repeat protein [Holophagaceae bacterium]|nr:tetratricopeptide repeat protein [Holophagaceae bacterium]
MPRLSLALIVTDEAPGLGRALASVQALCEERVVLDAGAPEPTRARAEALGARVIPFLWTGSFAEARAAAVAACTGDWILLLEPDEAIDALDQEALRAALEAEVSAHRLLRRSYLRTGTAADLEGPVRANLSRYTEGCAFPHCTEAGSVRLLRNLPGLTFEGRLRGLPDAWLEQGGHTIAPLDVVVHHYGRTEVGRTPAQARRRFDLARDDAEADPGNPRFQEELLRQALALEAWEVALQAAEQHQRMQVPTPFAVSFGGGLALQHLDRHVEALACFERILGEEPRHGAALAAAAESLWLLGRIEEAQERFTQALEADPGYGRTYLKLAELVEGSGLWEDARLVLEAGLDQNPKDLALWEALVGRGAARKDARAARDAWNALQQVPEGGRGLWHQLVIQAFIARNQIQDAREVLRRGLAAAPENADLLALQIRMGAGSGPFRLLRG